MSTRALRLVKAIEYYVKNKPRQFDSSIVLSKVTVQSLSDNSSRSTFKVDQSMCNGGDTLHGGFIAACVDTLSTFAHLGTTGNLAWTMSLHVDFISAARIGEDITVETSTMRQGKFPLIETRLSSKGVLVAKGVTSHMNGGEKYQAMAKQILGFEDVK